MKELEQIIEYYKERISDKKKWIKIYSSEEYKKDRLEKYLEINILTGVIENLKSIK